MAERRLEVKILGDSRSLERAFGRSRKSASGLNKSLGGLARVGKVIVGGFILSKAVKGIKDTIDAASDLNESVSKTGVIFGKSAGQVVKFADKASQSLGLSKTAALDASSTFATFGKSAGLSGKELTGFSTQLVTLSADLASFYNTSPEAAITAIGSALRGEAEPIRKYGVLLDAASLQQEALRQGLVKTTKQALTPQQKVLAAQALILAQTTDAQGDFARTSDGAANQQRILAAEVENAQASIGEGLLPAMAAILPLINRVIRAVVPALRKARRPSGSSSPRSSAPISSRACYRTSGGSRVPRSSSSGTRSAQSCRSSAYSPPRSPGSSPRSRRLSRPWRAPRSGSSRLPPPSADSSR